FLDHASVFAFFLGIGVGDLLAAVIMIYIYRSNTASLEPKKDGYMFGPQEVILEDDGIRIRSRLNDSLFKWNAVCNVFVTETHAIFMVDRFAGIIVPKRCLSCDEEFDEFVREVQKNRGQQTDTN